jgi:hypothetical protein
MSIIEITTQINWQTVQKFKRSKLEEFLMLTVQHNVDLEVQVKALTSVVGQLTSSVLEVAEGLNDYPPCTQPSISRNDASKKLRQLVADAQSDARGPSE